MSDAPKNYRVKYEVHCKLQNFFNKEMIVKRCLSALHAKAKLDDYCKKTYGIEYQCIIVTACTEEDNIMDAFDSIFGKGFGDKKSTYNDSFADIIKNLKNKQK